MRENWKGQGISLENLDAKFHQDSATSSNLLLEGKMLLAYGKIKEATEKFAKGAAMEEDLSRRSAAVGNMPISRIHGFEAAGWWARAGNVYQAIYCCDQLLGQADLPDRQRKAVQEFADLLHSLMAQWQADMNGDASKEEELETAEAEG